MKRAPPFLGPVEIDGNPTPAGGTFGWLPREGDVGLRYALWQEPRSESAARGTVVLLTGRTEYIEKYFEVIGELLDRGFAVAAVDARGQGLSSRLLADPRKGHVADFQDYVADLKALLEDVVITVMPEPLLLLSHSMGGQIGLRFLHDHPKDFAAAVLSAPMTGLIADGVPEPVALSLAGAASVVAGREIYIPGQPPFDPLTERFEDNVVTYDERRFLRSQNIQRARPDLALGPPTLGWLIEALRAMAETRTAAFTGTITTPVLIAGAKDELLIDNKSQQTVADLLPNGMRLEIEGARHEILMGTDNIRAAFWRAFDEFVRQFA